MKKIFTVLSLCLAAVCLSACNGGGEEPEPDRYAALNEMLHAQYSQIELTVTDTFDEDTFLKSEFTFSFPSEGCIAVGYSAERFSEIGGLDELPPSVKTTISGEGEYRDGVLVSDSGGLLPDRLAGAGLVFKEEYFGNAVFELARFRADVLSADGFLGISAFRGSEMRVEATFVELFYDMEIVYTAEDGSRVEYLFAFGW